MDALVERLLEANLKLTQEYTSLVRAVLEAKSGVYAPQVVPVPTPPSFEEFAATQEMTPEEKLFYSEEEEDEKYRAELHGADPGTDPQTLKEILEAAGLNPTVTTA